MRNHARLMVGTSLIGACLVLTACGGGSGSNPLQTAAGAPKGTIVIGSQSFPESSILGEVYAQALEGAGYKVKRQPNIGAREVIYGQVKSCSIDVVPEYNGALLSYLKTAGGGTISASPQKTTQVDAALAEQLPKQLSVLNSSSAQDNNAISVTKETADKYNLKSIADLAPVASKFVFGGPPEFKTRENGILGMEKEYGVNFKEYRTLDYSGPITITALKGGTVQTALLFTTTPQISTDNFVVLSDPKGVLGVNNIIPLVCTEAVDAGARTVLNTISADMTTTSLIGMNRAFTLDKKNVGDVAGKWLKDNGIKTK